MDQYKLKFSPSIPVSFFILWQFKEAVIGIRKRAKIRSFLLLHILLAFLSGAFYINCYFGYILCSYFQHSMSCVVFENQYSLILLFGSGHYATRILLLVYRFIFPLVGTKEWKGGFWLICALEPVSCMAHDSLLSYLTK